MEPTNLIKRSELDILNNYPLMKLIKFESYVSDFILKNPTNFPYTSFVMSHNTLRDCDIKKYFNIDNVKSCIYNIRNYNYLRNDVINFKLHTFTWLAISMLHDYKDSKFCIIRDTNKIIFLVEDGDHENQFAIFDSDFNVLYIVTNIFYSKICNAFMSNLNETLDTIITTKLDIPSYYKFDFTTFQNYSDINNLANIVFMLSNCKINSTIDNTVYNYPEINLHESSLNVFAYTHKPAAFEKFKFTNEVLKKENKAIHVNEVVPFENLDKMISEV